MIIAAKATKSDGPERAANPYTFTEEKPSKKPVILAGLMTGFALYLKSIFPGWGQVVAAAEPAGEPEAQKTAPTLVDLSTEATTEPTEDPETVAETAALGNFGYFGSGGQLVEPQGSLSLLTVEAPQLKALAVPAVAPPVQRSSSVSGLPRRSANDNDGPAASSGNGVLPDTLDLADWQQAIDDLEEILPDDDFPQPSDDSDEPDADEEDDDDADPDENAANRAPRTTGPVYLNDIFSGAAMVIGLSELLSHASDPDGDPLSIVNLTISSGTLTQVPEGWSFAAAMLGPVTLTYQISDGALTVFQHAYFNVLAGLPVIGTPDADTLVGTECADDIAGGCGDDNIDARGGDDTISGGGGADHIVAGNGGDVVRAGDGDDVVFGGAGIDWISGGKGNDRLFGGDDGDTLFGDDGDDALHGEAGDDLLFGGAGNDVAFGGAGNDGLDGGAGNDRLDGGDGDDALLGGSGDDRLEGGAGDDLIADGTGADTVFAGTGDDTVVGEADGTADAFDGGDGHDTLDYGAVTGSIAVDLETGAASGEAIGNDAIAGFEAVKTGSGDDLVTGSAAGEEIETGAGDDVVADGAGADVVVTGTGNDTVQAALDAVTDTYDGGAGLDTLDYSATRTGVFIDLNEQTATGLEIGTDQVSGFEKVVGGSGDDTFVVVAEQPVALHGGAGEDVFEFQAASGSSAQAQVVHDILDFMVGDRIKIDKYEIFNEVMDSIEDRFEDIYGDSIEEEDLPIRIRHEGTDSLRQTMIDVDFDGDDIYEMTINISGDHILLVVDNTTNTTA